MFCFISRLRLAVWLIKSAVFVSELRCSWSSCVSPECSSAAPSAGKEWEEYIQIRGLVEKIRKKQKGEYKCR